MVITQLQLETFSQSAIAAVARRLANQARARLSSLVPGSSDEHLLALARRAVDVALTAGIKTEPSIWRYFHLALRCGNRATMTIDAPWAALILSSTSRTADGKVSALWREYRALRSRESGPGPAAL